MFVLPLLLTAALALIGFIGGGPSLLTVRLRGLTIGAVYNAFDLLIHSTPALTIASPEIDEVPDSAAASIASDLSALDLSLPSSPVLPQLFSTSAGQTPVLINTAATMSQIKHIRGLAFVSPALSALVILVVSTSGVLLWKTALSGGSGTSLISRTSTRKVMRRRSRYDVHDNIAAVDCAVTLDALPPMLSNTLAPFGDGRHLTLSTISSTASPHSISNVGTSFVVVNILAPLAALAPSNTLETSASTSLAVRQPRDIARYISHIDIERFNLALSSADSIDSAFAPIMPVMDVSLISLARSLRPRSSRRGCRSGKSVKARQARALEITVSLFVELPFGEEREIVVASGPPAISSSPRLLDEGACA